MPNYDPVIEPQFPPLPGHGRFPIYYLDSNEEDTVDNSEVDAMPIWQTSPVLKRNWANRNILRDPKVFFNAKTHDAYNIGDEATRCMETGEVIFGGFDSAPPGGPEHEDFKTSFYATILSTAARSITEYLGDPMAYAYIPIFDSFNVEERKTVAVLLAAVNWGMLFRRILPENVRGVTLVIENSCDGMFTYEIDGEDVIPIGVGDLHDGEYSGLGASSVPRGGIHIEDGTVVGLKLNTDRCKYSAHVYPAQEFYDDHYTSTPLIITVTIALVFLFTVCMFLFYDRLVEQRQQIVLQRATQSSAIVLSLFVSIIEEKACVPIQVIAF